MTRKVVLELDDQNFSRLKSLQEKLQAEGEPECPGVAIREAVAALLELFEQREKGFTQMVLRNPKDKTEKEFFVPGREPVTR